MATDTQILDLDGVNQQAYTFRFDLLDATLTKVGTVAPQVASPPKIDNDATRPVARQMSGLILPPDQQALVNPLIHRIRPMLVLASGGEYPLGVFIFSDAARSRETWGLTMSGTLTDLLSVIDQGIGATITVAAGTNVSTALRQVFTGSALAGSVVIATTAAVVMADMTWAIGTSLLKVVNDIGALGAMWPCYTDNSGIPRLDLVPDLSTAPVEHTYNAGGRIYPGTILESDNLLTAPNRYVVVDTSATTAPVSGTYDIPDSAPHSELNRGFVVQAPRIDLPGVGTPAQAAAAAKAAAAADVAYQKVTFAGPPDPRHDTHDVVSFLLNTYYETSWSMTCSVGAPMTHELQRVYS